MARPKSNAELLHSYALYIVKGEGYESASFGNMSYRKTIAYSYAAPVVNALKDAVLVSENRYSNTTAGHISDYVGMLHRSGVGVPYLYVPVVAEPTDWRNYVHLADRVSEALLRVVKPRLREASRFAAILDAERGLTYFDTLTRIFGVHEVPSVAHSREMLAGDHNIIRLRSIMALTNFGGCNDTARV